MANRERPTQEHLIKLFDYDAISGRLTWKSGRKMNGRPAGSLGCHRDGKPRYRLIEIKMPRGRWSSFRSSHLVWIYSYGDMPPGSVIDHINHDSLDDRLENLRACTPTENARNKRIYRNNTSGIRGVYQRNGRWSAWIKISKKQVSVGTFATAQEAASARSAAEGREYGRFSPHKTSSPSAS